MVHPTNPNDCLVCWRWLTQIRHIRRFCDLQIVHVAQDGSNSLVQCLWVKYGQVMSTGTHILAILNLQIQVLLGEHHSDLDPDPDSAHWRSLLVVWNLSEKEIVLEIFMDSRPSGLKPPVDVFVSERHARRATLCWGTFPNRS